MFDLDRVEGFQWDAGNDRKSAEKNGVSQAEAEQVFFSEPLIMAVGGRHSAQEARWHALGQSTAGRLLHLTFTLRNEGKAIRVISARDMHKKERAVYEQVG